MESLSFGFPAVLMLLVLQIAISLFWVRPLFRYGLIIFRRPISIDEALPSESIQSGLSKLNLPTLAIRKLSDTEIGIRCSFFFGFTGVQGVISTRNSASFTARLGWPAVLFYAFTLGILWSHYAGSLASVVTPTLIVLAIPTIDVLQMRHAIAKLVSQRG